MRATGTTGWWERPWLLGGLVLLTMLPFLAPDVPPLVDLPGHMGRYRVQLDLARSVELQRFYRFEWALIGNLGLDLLVVPLSKLFGLEAAVKLIVTLIPALTCAGFLWVAREVHGRVPPTAFFAVPLVFNYPLHFGFANFALSMAFAFLAFAYWLRLGRLGAVKRRAALFVPFSVLIWITHVFGWGTLGLMAFAAETIRQRDGGRTWSSSAFGAATQCLSMTLPLLLMLIWRGGGAAGTTGDWFNWLLKLQYFSMVLRDRWIEWDLFGLLLLSTLLVIALRSPRLVFSRILGASALALGGVFLLLPRIVFGSAYADMRLAPYALAVAILAIRPGQGFSPSLAAGLAAAGLAFATARLGANTASFILYDRAYDHELAALDRLPRGAKLVSFVGTACTERWGESRLDHLPALAIVRREAFSNDQWTMAGAQLLDIVYPQGGAFIRDPSQLVTKVQCPKQFWLSLDQALSQLPRHAFDYLWLIDPPAYDARLTAGLRPLWRSGSSVLYQIVDRRSPTAPEAPR